MGVGERSLGLLDPLPKGPPFRQAQAVRCGVGGGGCQNFGERRRARAEMHGRRVRPGTEGGSDLGRKKKEKDYTAPARVTSQLGRCECSGAPWLMTVTMMMMMVWW